MALTGKGGHLDIGTVYKYLYGGLGDAEKKEVEDHLAECPKCKSGVNAIRYMNENPGTGRQSRGIGSTRKRGGYEVEWEDKLAKWHRLGKANSVNVMNERKEDYDEELRKSLYKMRGENRARLEAVDGVPEIKTAIDTMVNKAQSDLSDLSRDIIDFAKREKEGDISEFTPDAVWIKLEVAKVERKKILQSLIDGLQALL